MSECHVCGEPVSETDFKSINRVVGNFLTMEQLNQMTEAIFGMTGVKYHQLSHLCTTCFMEVMTEAAFAN